MITAELSRTQAQPGDKIRLIETVPVDPDTKISTVTHKLYVIGEYDYATKSLINYEPGIARFWGAGIVFDDCNISGSVGSVCDKAMPFDITNPRQEGFEFDFKARQIGIYMIISKWNIYHSDEVIESNPVILTVRPPLDKAGKPIIKEEWIDKTAWKYRPK